MLMGGFQKCEKYGWRYLVRFKQGSIPTVQEEYFALAELQKNEYKCPDGAYDFVNGIGYKELSLNYVH